METNTKTKDTTSVRLDLPFITSSISNNRALPEHEKGEDLIPNHVQHYLDIVFTMTLLPTVAMFGVISNILNIIVFLKTGVRDCVSICLLSLAILDLGVSFLGFSYGVIQIIVSTKLYFYVDPLSVLVFLAWTKAVFSDATMYHTAFLSIERCLCVLFPFHFKNLMTPRKAYFVVIGIYVLAVLCYIPHFISVGFSEQFDADYNTTRIMLWYSDDRVFMEHLMNVYETLVMNFLNLAIVIVCTVGMITGLRRSSKFTSGNSKTSDSVSSRKNRNVVKMVSIICVVYIVCVSTRSAVVVPRFFVDGINPYEQHHNVYQTITTIFVFFGVLNSSVNIFVYYSYKPRFKDILLHMLRSSLENVD